MSRFGPHMPPCREPLGEGWDINVAGPSASTNHSKTAPKVSTFGPLFPQTPLPTPRAARSIATPPGAARLDGPVRHAKINQKVVSVVDHNDHPVETFP